ncbi:threonine/serine exporter family protein [Domibacillus indicus]|uniref:threonine/serine exporter family protein n=1 Tax=Domibacillus indicus TaxID=1437523 RepID=UPI000617F6B2|nr:threonine/serine exporter family protein [Domibacillus indicus]
MDALLEKQYDIMDVSLLAGKIMLESGAETYRVEDTMMRIALSYGIEESHSFVTPTGIMFSIETDEPTKTKLMRISSRTTDLYKVSAVNAISRRISAGELTVSQAYKELKAIQKAPMFFSFLMQIAAAASTSGCFVILLKGSWDNVLPAMLAGALAYFLVLKVADIVPTMFFSDFIAALAGGGAAYLLFRMGLGSDLDRIIVGTLIPLVPGLLITNAVRDLMAGHFLSGLAKGAEALLTALAIGTGIAVVMTLI